jgi:adenylosuccinate synthase
VRQAISVNQPTRVVLNHVDLIDASARGNLTQRAADYIGWVESEIDHPVDLVGLGPDHLAVAHAREAARP